MDVIIPLGTGSRWNNNELKYALRSIEKHLKGYENIYIVGECPKWLNLEDINHIPAKDTAGRKEYSIFNKILKACQDERVSDDFVFWNDDIFMCQDLHVKDFKYWYEGTLQDKYEQSHGHYKAAIGNVINTYDAKCPYTDIHVPIIYTKYKFDYILTSLDWMKEYVIKSTYTSAVNHHDFEPMPDLKINKAMTYGEIMAKINGRLFFSIGTYGVSSGMTSVLRELYPNKSKYEI